MDACFEIYVPAVVNIAGLMRLEKVLEWGGEMYPQAPVQYSWGARVRLIETIPPPIASESLTGKVDVAQWVGMLVQSEVLDLYKIEVNGGKVDWGGPETFEEFVRLQLLSQRSWAASFLPGWERLDDILEGNVDDLIRMLAESLQSGEDMRGFVMWHCK